MEIDRIRRNILEAEKAIASIEYFAKFLEENDVDTKRIRSLLTDVKAALQEIDSSNGAQEERRNSYLDIDLVQRME
jgi:hypothetical protein